MNELFVLLSETVESEKPILNFNFYFFRRLVNRAPKAPEGQMQWWKFEWL